MKTEEVPMDQVIMNFKDKVKVLADGYRSGSIDVENSDAFFYDVIYAAAEVYKNDMQLYMPMSNGQMMVYQEEDRNYIPLYTDKEELMKSGAKEYQTTTLREKCAYVYDNLMYYDLLANLDVAVEEGRNLSEIVEYVESNPKFEGVILDPFTEYPFGMDGWILKAVMFKGMGVNTFDVIDGESGEVKYRL